MIEDDFYDSEDDFDQPVIRIPQRVQTAQAGQYLLKEADLYLQNMSAAEHEHLIRALRSYTESEAYFDVLADELNQKAGYKVANDALNLTYIWTLINQHETDLNFDVLNVIQTDYFQVELFKAFDQLETGDQQNARKCILEEALRLYEMKCYAGCIALLYAQLEGLLTDVLVQKGFLKQNGTKFVDVYKIVPGLKGNEIKSLWHKAKIAAELNPYFLELSAYKMDNSSIVSETRHNILHGTELAYFTRERSFVLFLWLFSVISFMSTIKH